MVVITTSFCFAGRSLVTHLAACLASGNVCGFFKVKDD